MDLFLLVFMGSIVTVIGVVMVLVGALLAGTGLATLRESLSARHWLPVFAAIDSSTVEEVARQEKRSFRPKLSYAYSTATGNFTGSRISFTERLYATEAAARKVADRYPAGTTVMGLCNPDVPTEAVLEIRWADGAGLLGFGLLCWVFPVGAVTAAGVPWPVSAITLLLMLVIPALLSLRQQSKLQEARRAGLYPPPGCGTDSHVAALAASGEKILAIKLYRELHSGGLKEAKAAVEAMNRPAGDKP